MKAIIFLFSLIFTFSSVFSQSGWFQQNTGTFSNYYSAYFINSSTGWVVGQFGAYLKTTNGGVNWNIQSPPSSRTLTSVFFISSSTGWAVGDSSTIIKTTNGGSSWQTLVSGLPLIFLSSVIFTDANTGYVSGQAGNMIKTTNGGMNWSVLNTSTTHSINCIYFPPSSTSLTGYTCGGTTVTSEVLKTSNGGINWVSQVIGANWLWGIHFTDLQTGWTAGMNGSMYSTTNGGLNWDERISGTTYRLVSVVFPNSSTGYIAGFNGIILKTTNSGTNWTPQQSTTTTYLYNVFFTDVNTGWATGWNGTVLHTTTGGVTYIGKISSEIPVEFKLFQNYPNPFNPSTKIRFDVPSHVQSLQLKVYDILGKEIAELFSGELQPGSYEVLWDASAYSSGIYFYRFLEENLNFTRSMILVR